MQARPEPDGQGGIGLRGLTLWLALFGAAIYLLAGWPPALPTLPSSWPSRLVVEVWLRSPLLPLEWLVPTTRVVAWLVWGWTCLTVLARIALDVLDGLTRGAAWVRSLRAASNWLTLPLVRRAVDASLAGAVMARVIVPMPAVDRYAPPHVTIGSAVPDVTIPASVASVPRGNHVAIVAHQAAQPTGVFFDTDAPADTDAPEGETDDASVTQPNGIIHTIQSGETWSGLAKRYLGDAGQAEYLLEANLGREQPDGRRVNRHGWIYPDWTVLIPAPTRGVVEERDGQRWYTVRPGDTLRGISVLIFGDEARHHELFELNRGARLDDGHVLTNPDLIWPGLVLRLPPLEAQAASPPAAPTEPDAAADDGAAPDQASHSAPANAPSPTPAPSPDATAVSPSAPAASEPVAPTIVPTAVPTVIVAAAPTPSVPDVAPRVSQPDQGPVSLSPVAMSVAEVLAGTALVGLGLAGVRKRRRRAPWDETDVEVTGGFAQANGDESAYEERAAGLAEQVLAFVGEQGCSSVRLLGAYAGRTGVGLVLQVAAEQGAQLTGAAEAFGAGPQAVHLKRTDDGDYQWEQAWSTVRPRTMGRSGERPGPRFIPLGVAGDRRILHAERSMAGTLLVAGQAVSGVHELLAYLVVDEARRQRPDELYLLTVARRDRLNPLLADLPHQRAGFVDPSDAVGVAEVLREVRSELERRLQEGQGDSPELLLVVDEWTDVPEPGSVLDLLTHHGPPVGIRVLAATTRADESVSRWVGLFRTRLVLQMPDAESSVRLLGEPGAEDLDRVGQLWPSLQGRVLHRIRGFRMPPLHLADLVAQMRQRAGLEDGEHTRSEGAGLEHDIEEYVRAVPPAAVVRDQEEVAQQDNMSPNGRAAPWEGQAPVSAPEACSPSVVDEDGVEARPDAAAHSLGQDDTVPAGNGADHQLSLIGAVVLPRDRSRVGEPAPATEVQACASDRLTCRLVELRLFGNQPSLVNAQEVTPWHYRKYRQGWSTLLAIGALPETKASTGKIGAMLWPQRQDVDGGVISNRIHANLSNARLVLQECGLGDTGARGIVRTEGGMCRLSADRVRVDGWEFLHQERTGNRARAAGRAADAIAAYRQVRAVYAGPLLHEQDATHPWVNERVEGGLTLREAYHGQYRESTERLAELLLDAGQAEEAAPLYRELLRDPYSLPSRGRDVLQVRQAHAQELFSCCQWLGDRAGLDQALEDLRAALLHDDREAGVARPSQPTAETMAVFEEVRGALSREAVGGRR